MRCEFQRTKITLGPKSKIEAKTWRCSRLGKHFFDELGKVKGLIGTTYLCTQHFEIVKRNHKMEIETKAKNLESWGVVHSTYGDFKITKDGFPIDPAKINKALSYEIVQFDLKEYNQYYNENDTDSFDILDLGYWYRREGGSISYEAPEEDFRKWMLEEQKLRDEQEADKKDPTIV